ncbi:MAG: SAM-dependent methyltransferase [Dehalococcoidia bacterium]
MGIELTPIGFVRGGRVEVEDDDWGAVEAEIELDPEQFEPDATASLGDFSHLVVVYHFDRVAEEDVQRGARRPRGNPDWPMVGILAQRAKARPNRIGVSTCEILAVDGLKVRVRGLDAIDGTPVLDIKPFMSGFEPRTPVREPEWARALMAGYW